VSRYGVLLAQLGKVGLLIRGLQQIKRIVPHDPEPRRPFIAGRVAAAMM
jgi:hypothetical protein